MNIIRITLAILSIAACSYYFVYQTDGGLLSDETLLDIAATDVLGNPLYGHSCPRFSYLNEVVTALNSGNARVVLFKFTPVVGKETQSPPVVVLMDRRTAESWIE